ncbi:hypothetical protein B0H19DRAFT_1291330 [Mycena capillaripes]|nr:hypothetical protein B0H19DRAFT_1291330 [Mycena capillaripes]
MPSADPVEERKGNGHGGKRPGAGRPRSGLDPGPVAKTRVLGQPLRQAPRLQHSHSVTLHPFFGTHQPPLGSPASPLVQSGRGSLWSTVGTSTSGAASQLVCEQDTSNSHISLGNFTQLNDQLDYIEEHDEHGDIATGDQLINNSLVDEVLDTVEANEAAAEAETHTSEAQTDSALHKHLLSVQKRLSAEIQKYGSPLCYRRGCPDRFKCTCGKPLSRNGFNDPIARRVRAMPADFFLLTNRFLCNPRHTEPGCNKSFQGTDPHVIAQLPKFVQTAFPAYISARGAVSKLMMWQMLNTFATRLGPAPFSELVSEIQHKFHAESELMYVAAADFYRQSGVQQFSAFNDPRGYAGSPPSTPYTKAMFTDFMAAYRIYIERDIATGPLTVMKLDHTFDFLKYIGGLKGENIFNAACTSINEHEEVQTHSLMATKSMSFFEDMFKDAQQGLKDAGHPPTSVVYTDSPQAECAFHESINQFLLQNVQPVTKWSDLPRFCRTVDVCATLSSDSFLIEEKASEILADALNGISLSQLYLVAVCIKATQSTGERPHIDIIQLRTKEGIYSFKVTALTSRSDFLPSLRAILTNPSIIKMGYSIRQTLQTISDVFGLPEIGQMAKARNPPILNLGKYTKLKGVLDDPLASLHALAGTVLEKLFSTPHSSSYPWSAALTSEDTEFLFSEIDCQWQGCKPIAEGSIVGRHNGYLDAIMDAAGNTTRINVSLMRSLIVISKVLVPGAIHALHGQTMEWIFNHGARAVVPTSQLHSRGEIAPVVVNAVSRAFTVPAPPSSFDESIEFTLTNSQDTNSIPLEFEHWSEDMMDDSDDSDNSSDKESDSEPEEDPYSRLVYGLLNIPIDILMENLNDTFSILRESEPFPSRVLDDAFHFMDRLLRLLLKKHSAFKAFAHDFSEAIFIRDKSDKAAVHAVLENYGVSWEYAKRAKAKSLNQRIRRYIPRRQVLLQRLQKLFDAYANMHCSTKKSRGRDRDGLNIYRTIRGTNSLEGGFHMTVRRIFGSLRASPELAECLLINWILCRNKRVGFQNRSVAVGVKPSFPLPRVLSTRIATSETIRILPISKSLANNLNITTLPRPRIVGVPHHRDTPVNLLTRLSTRTVNIYRYLQLQQLVLYALVPVHTHQEYITFKIIISDQRFRKTSRTTHPPHEQWKNIDFTKMAQSWNERVHHQPRTITDSNQRLYYKLPQHLEAHHKKTLLWNSECATLASGSNFAARKALIEILEAPENHTDVLPALPLPGPIPDGEVDLSIGASNKLLSFDHMAEPVAQGEPPNSEFFEFEQGSTLAENLLIQVAFETLTDSESQTIPPMHPMQHQPPIAQHQPLFPGASASATVEDGKNVRAKADRGFAPAVTGIWHLARGTRLKHTSKISCIHCARMHAASMWMVVGMEPQWLTQFNGQRHGDGDGECGAWWKGDTGSRGGGAADEAGRRVKTMRRVWSHKTKRRDGACEVNFVRSAASSTKGKERKSKHDSPMPVSSYPRFPRSRSNMPHTPHTTRLPPTLPLPLPALVTRHCMLGKGTPILAPRRTCQRRLCPAHQRPQMGSPNAPRWNARAGLLCMLLEECAQRGEEVALKRKDGVGRHEHVPWGDTGARELRMKRGRHQVWEECERDEKSQKKWPSRLPNVPWSELRARYGTTERKKLLSWSYKCLEAIIESDYRVLGRVLGVVIV